MKNYPHIISKLFYEPLLITRAKHSAICKVLEAHINGEQNQFDEGRFAEDEDDGQEQVSGPDIIIPIHGIIGTHLSGLEMASGGCDLHRVGAAIDAAVASSKIKRIIFDINSPGGTVTGVPELARKIAHINAKDTVAYTDSECCSAALWLATQCQSFFATESSTVGSIGVWCAYLDISRRMANEGENMQEISAGKYKTMGAYWKPLTSEERDMIQAQVDRIYSQFKAAVNLRRKVADSHMQGQIFDGIEAVEVGLSDGLVEGLEEIL